MRTMNIGDEFDMNAMHETMVPTTNAGLSPTGNNYSMQDVLNALGRTGDMLSGVASQMGLMATKVNNISDKVSALDERMGNLELNEEITEDMYKEIKHALNRHIDEILNHDPVQRAKYFRGFASKFYSEARKNTSCAYAMRRTKKRDYQSVLDYVEAWYPCCGAPALKREIDDRAELRRKLKEEGYEQ